MPAFVFHLIPNKTGVGVELPKCGSSFAGDVSFGLLMGFWCYMNWMCWFDEVQIGCRWWFDTVEGAAFDERMLLESIGFGCGGTKVVEEMSGLRLVN